MLKLTLPPPPAPKRKRRKDKNEDPSPYAETIASLESLVDRIGIIRQTAPAALKKEQDKALGKGSDDRDWAAVFCQDVLKPLYVVYYLLDYPNSLLGLKSRCRSSMRI